MFLDEIGELSPTVQAKLLRVLQERNFQRVGGTFQVESDFRLLTATHRNLAEEVKNGRFREDLFFRLAVYELELPPLRRRKEDIAALAYSFIREHKVAMGSKATGFSAAALDVLQRHNWPGNVRELQNVMQRALVVAEHEEIRPEDLPERIRSAGSASPEKDGVRSGESTEDEPLETPDTLEDASKRLLLAAMVKHEGNASAVMRELNVGRTRFYRMLRKFDLEGRIDDIRQTGKSAAQ